MAAEELFMHTRREILRQKCVRGRPGCGDNGGEDYESSSLITIGAQGSPACTLGATPGQPNVLSSRDT